MKENEKIWAVKDGYLVHRDGSIYKLNWNNTGKMRKVKQSANNNGYLAFTCNGKGTYSHRFIAECFIPNPDNLPCVNHKDETPSNNHVNNLEWCTHKYNMNYGTCKERVSKSLTGIKRSEETRKKMSKSQRNNPKKTKTVYQYTKDGVLVKEWCSIMEIERVLGFANQNISACCRGECKSAYDFIWRYK